MAKVPKPTERAITSQIQNESLVLERRERIISAAIIVFRTHGYHDATTKDVAKEAGMTQSNLYNYVSSKQDVLFMVCDHLVNLYQRAVDDAVAKSEGPHEALVQALSAIISVMSLHKDELQLLYNETHALEKPDRKIILATISKLIRAFEDLLKRYEKEYGPCDVKNRRIAANFLSFVPSMVALRSWDMAAHASREEVNAALLRFILAGLNIPFDLPVSKRLARVG